MKASDHHAMRLKIFLKLFSRQKFLTIGGGVGWGGGFTEYAYLSTLWWCSVVWGGGGGGLEPLNNFSC
jgi:hypothetical protein